MTTAKRYGSLNAHHLGYILKEMVRRAIGAIRAELAVFEAQVKMSYAGEMNDVVTSADKAAQKVYVKMMREAFPTYGIIAEEDDLRIPCTDTELGDIYFTVDPVDGTKALARRQSHGIGTMVALVLNGEVIAAYVGDVMTNEVYGYRPESARVHRIGAFEKSEDLIIDPNRRLAEQNLLLRKRPESHGPLVRKALALPKEGGLFRDFQIADGSVGISMARLWKGEVGAAVIGAKHETPWDATPVVGISKKLGFVFLAADETGRFVPCKMPPLKEVTPNREEILVIHGSRVNELHAWLNGET